jgi:hypothetical protein
VAASVRALAISSLLVLVVPTASCVLSLSEPQGCQVDGCPAGQACVADQCVEVAASPDGGAPAPPPAADAGIDEVAVPDAAPPAVQSCDELFGAASGYVLCGEDATSCSFFVQSDGTTCSDECGLLGSECVGGYDSNADAPCTVITEDGCLATHTTKTCACARPAATAVTGP